MGSSLIPWRKHYLKPYKRPKLKRTICEVLREMYRDALARGDHPTMQRLDEAHDMAKRMQRKLQEYNKDEMILSEWKHNGAAESLDRV